MSSTAETPGSSLQAYLRLRSNYARAHGRSVSWVTCLRGYPPWRNSLRAGRSPIEDRIPWVVFGALDYLRGVVRRGHSVFEFGMGGSSLFFLDRGCVLTSVEHDAAWHQSVRERIPAKANWRDLIRPPTPWPERGERQPCYGSGFPGCEHQCFRDYLAPLEAARENSFNLILVDGRARAGALEAAESKVVPGGWLILDNAERTRYAEAQEHLKRKGWRLRRFSGPGPYVQHEFWDTNIWIRPLT